MLNRMRILTSKRNNAAAQAAATSQAGIRALRLSAVAAAAVIVSACTLVPKYERPEAPVASEFPGKELSQEGQAVSETVLPEWQDFVTEPKLRTLIAQALTNNRDLRVAALNIEKAQAQYRVERSDLAPTLGLGVNGNRTRVGDNAPITQQYQGGLMVSTWEIDLFGRIRSLSQAAQAAYLSTEYARNAVQTSLVSNVAQAWLNLQNASAMLTLTEKTLETRAESERLMQLRFDNGVVSALDLSQAQSLTATAEVTYEEQKRARKQAINALTLLVGETIEPSLLNPVDVPLTAFGDVPAGLPSELLTRRPDIQEAEQNLIAANANIGAARAAFFPSITLTGSVGSASSQLSDLFKSGSFAWNIAPQALLTIFDFGRNRAQLEIAKADRDIAVAQYEKSIQTAFSEVADALAGRATLTEQLRAQERLVQAEQKRYDLSYLRYSSGVSSFLDALDAQRSLFTAQQNYLQTRTDILANRVQVYSALGGGWNTAPAHAFESEQSNEAAASSETSAVSPAVQ